jgi:hypothetical protein
LGNSDDSDGRWNHSDEQQEVGPTANSCTFDRKVSPPFLAVLSDSRVRSGSDPTISMHPGKKILIPNTDRKTSNDSNSSPKSGQ